jgi:hypothetical protein
MTMELTRALPEKVLPRHQERQAVVYVPDRVKTR